MKLSTMQYRGYTAKITNLSTMEEIQDWVQECNITLPTTTLISSLEAKFSLDEKKLSDGNEVKIEILDEVGNILYTLQGKVSIPKRSKSYTGKEAWEYSIKDSYDKLFDRVVPENMTFYDLYMCNVGDKENSLLHKIARALGFQDSQTDFVNITYDNGEFIRVPFVHFEEKARWIDKLQSFKEANDGILYVKNGKLFFRPRNLAIDNGLRLDRTNIITNIEVKQKDVLQNGVKVVYDRFEKLENQVVFNLSKKVITEPNTALSANVPTMRISYITSAVSNPTLTKATGYYFTTDDPNSKVDVVLQKDIHYKIESWKETGVEVKFLNPYGYKLYVDSFEIKGVPLSSYMDNEVNVMFKSVEQKHQENFITASKNKLVQTSKQAEFLAKKFMRRGIRNNKEYQFFTHFLHNIELGGVYALELEDIRATVEVKTIKINLKTSNFRMDIQAEDVQEPLGDVKTTSKTTATPKGNYVDLKPIEDKVKKAENKVKLLEQDVRSTLHRMETQPTENVKENDVWLNPKTNVWKKYYNNVWNPISEAEILPSMKMYNSIKTNIIKFQNTADKVGAYLLNDGEKFGGLNGELAHTTFDKLGQFESENPNNRVALNIKDPANPSRVTSQILLGVTNVKDPKWKDTVLAIGDEASPVRMQFKNGRLIQTVNGKEISEKLGEVDKNINNVSSGIASSLSTAKAYADSKKAEAIQDSKSYADTKKAEVESKVTGLQNDMQRQITFEVGGEANKYYPVLFTATKKLCRFIVHRSYYEKAPATWNTATHMGGLQLEMTTNFGSTWDGDPNEIVVHKFLESYTKIASKIHIPQLSGTLVWLRGGGAVYHAYADDVTVNKTLAAQVLLQGYDNPPRRKDYPETEIGKAGTYSETGSASTIKALSPTLKVKEVDTRLTNADGKLTTLQQQYQDTVKDLTSFKTQTSASIDTVQGALSQGDFTITGRTVFDGSARFVSRGTNEVITIANGAIDFNRDGKRLTRIKNIRYGTISTDSKGKGVVNFEGFKPPLLVLPTIKSVNFGRNMASAFCYAEQLEATRFRFFIGGTNELYQTPKNIKTVGTVVNYTNIYQYTIDGIGFTFPESWYLPRAADINKTTNSNSNRLSPDYFKGNHQNKKFVFEYGYGGGGNSDLWGADKRQYDIGLNYVTPTFKIELKEYVNGKFTAVIFSKTVTLSWRHGEKGYYNLYSYNATQSLNIMRSFTARSNVKVEMEITFTEPRFCIKGTNFYKDAKTIGGRDGYTQTYHRVAIYHEFELVRLSKANFVGYNITSSHTSSKISDSIGEGEVSYIAMEID